MKKTNESHGKFLSLVLRHQPEVIGLSLDEEGWADLDTLISLSNAKGTKISKEIILEIVATNDKKRYCLSDDGLKIRANQGHSIAVDLGLTAIKPPDILYHGTATRFAGSIREQGLLPKSRQHVHLSALETTAIEVGKRHGAPLVIKVRALDMHQKGHRFFLSQNGVWLTAKVGAEFLEFPQS